MGRGGSPLPLLGSHDPPEEAVRDARPPGPRKVWVIGEGGSPLPLLGSHDPPEEAVRDARPPGPRKVWVIGRAGSPLPRLGLESVAPAGRQKSSPEASAPGPWRPPSRVRRRRAADSPREQRVPSPSVARLRRTLQGGWFVSPGLTPPGWTPDARSGLKNPRRKLGCPTVYGRFRSSLRSKASQKPAAFAMRSSSTSARGVAGIVPVDGQAKFIEPHHGKRLIAADQRRLRRRGGSAVIVAGRALNGPSTSSAASWSSGDGGRGGEGALTRKVEEFTVAHGFDVEEVGVLPVQVLGTEQVPQAGHPGTLRPRGNQPEVGILDGLLLETFRQGEQRADAASIGICPARFLGVPAAVEQGRARGQQRSHGRPPHITPGWAHRG